MNNTSRRRHFTAATLGLVFFLIHAPFARVQAAVTESSVVDSTLQPVEQGADFQVWQRIQTLRDAGGNTLLVTNPAFVELQTGMHYLEEGQWKVSREVIESYAGGAVARYGGHKVIFAENFGSPVVVDLETPDGKRLQSRVLGLSYLDSASGKSVLFAESSNVPGQIVNTNQVIYPDAFSNVKADVRYTYTKAGLEQDVILVERPAPPESFGLDSKTTSLQVLTEFMTAPVPGIETNTLGAGADRFEDQTLDFGVMQMGTGRAFLLGDSSAPETTVGKRWTVVAGRTILSEEVAVAQLAKQLETLPVRKRTAFFWKKSNRQLAAARLNLPARKTTKPAKRAMQMAQAMPQTQPGLVLDYVLLSSQANLTFKGDSTYYVNGLVNLTGTTTIEGGAVVKYTNLNTARIILNGPVSCQTAAYRPAIFTAKDDNSVGDIIPGSSGNPGNNYYGGAALTLASGIGNNSSLTNLHIRYLRTGLSSQMASYTILSVIDCQFVNCQSGVSLYNNNQLRLRNTLFANITNAIYDSSYYNTTYVNAQQVTFDHIAYLASRYAPPLAVLDVSFENCVVASVSQLSAPGQTSVTFSGDSNGFYPSAGPVFGVNQFPTDTDPFQTEGKGNYYLAINPAGIDLSNFRNLGTTAIDPALLAALTQKTTRPPLVYDGTVTTLRPRSLGDTGAPDLGYHYDVLDYYASGVSDALTLASGVAVGIYGPYGFTSGALTSIGSPSKHNKIALYSTVQEQPGIFWANASATSLMNNSMVMNWRFTDLSLAGGALFGGGTAPADMNVVDCSLHAVRMNFSQGYGAVLGFTNNILERCTFEFGNCNYSYSPYSPPPPMNFYNNLFLKGSLSFGFYCSGDFMQGVTIKNNLFVNGSCTYGTGSSYAPVIANNGYFQTTVTSYGTNPKYITSTNFQTGLLGSYYYPLSPGTTGTGTLTDLINAGNMTAQAAGLSSYTTQPDQTPDSGQVDIGFHYHHIGQIKWTWTNTCGNYPAFSSSPAIGNNGIIYVTDFCNLYAIDPTTHELWTAWAAGPFPIGSSPELQSSPMISANGLTIYVGTADTTFGNATLYAVNVANGTLKWGFSPNAPLYFSTAALATDGTIYVGNMKNPNYYAVIDNTTQGVIKSGFPIQLGDPGDPGAEIEASAAIGADGLTTYVATEEGDLGTDPSLFAVNESGMVIWEYQLFDSYEYHRSPSVGSDGTVYIGDEGGSLYAFYPDPQTAPQTQTKWIYHTPGSSAITTTPIIGSDGTIYFGSLNVLYAVTNGVLKWSHSFGSGNAILSTPALAADGTLYVSSTDDNLYAMPTDSSAPYGGPLWQVAVPASAGFIYLTSSPAIGIDGMVYIGGYDGKLYAIQGVTGPASSPWPMWRKNNAHQANAALP